jgi:uncharacterized membrane protein YkvA (DUF1232 family)
MNRIEGWKKRVKDLKTETYAIYLASKDPRVPWYTKVIIVFTVFHTFSPIDLIPDFIPVLGYLDDLIITPLGIWLALKTIPDDVLIECRAEAQKIIDQEKPTFRFATAIVISIWIIVLAIVINTIYRMLKRRLLF